MEGSFSIDEGCVGQGSEWVFDVFIPDGFYFEKKISGYSLEFSQIGGYF